MPPIAGLVFHECTHLPLARGKVRYVGEPIVMVVAESRYLAEDALRDVVVHADPLEAVVDLERALAADAPLVHEHLQSNAAAHVVQRKGEIDLVTSLAWGVYALVLLLLGTHRRVPALRQASLAILVLAVGKVFLHDLAHLEGLWRVASLAGLALSLLAVSLLYQRFVFRRETTEG